MAGDVFNERILSSELPSVFELFAKESMEAQLRPAIEYVIKTLSDTIPERFSSLWNVKDELVTLVHAMIDGYFIFWRSASFAEHFYGLQCCSRQSRNQPLPWARALAVFLITVMGPYLTAKMESLTRSAQDQEGQEQDCGQQWRVVSACCSLASVACLVCKLLYLTRRSVYASPWLWLVGVVIHRSTPNTSNGWWSTALLIGSAYLLRSVEWWYTEEGGGQLQAALNLPIPPTPHMLQSKHSSRHCLLCGRGHHNPAALASSGLVLCYSCALVHVNREHACPLTGLPTQQDQIIRLYVH